MKWVYYEQFEDIPVRTLYDILKLRQDIFIIEQDCIYEDIDRLDLHSSHLVLFDEESLAGYSRLVPPGVKYDDISIGRIAISQDYRNRGLGKELVQRSIRIAESAGFKRIRIEAQTYLNEFYRELGFRSDGDEYILDGIPHREMIWTASGKEE
ncbi:MAG: GNAT family N-acetyltransferase [Balneolaceae bacterium]|nr:GNAT family N-acetyltransferase [Balneolaceae bacterium]